MFSGLVRECGKIKSFKENKLTINSNLHPKLGDSIAINGVCLTAIESLKGSFSVELSKDTRGIIAIENFEPNKIVHIEPALRASDRLDGHFVQGHIDGVGTIVDIKNSSEQTNLKIKIPPHISKFLIPKGSVSIDGVSLTIVNSDPENLELTIIPHTLKNTIFGQYMIGTRVNIETDMLVRSVVRTIENLNNKKPISWGEVDSILMGF